jgi:hypothetical protein
MRATSATVAAVAARADGPARVMSSNATLAGSAATTHARWTRTPMAAEPPRKRCTSSTLSMPNARFSARIRLGRTAAHTRADSASSP